MAKHSAQSGVQLVQRRAVAEEISLVEQNRDQKSGRKDLQDISGEHDQPGLLSQHSQGIRRTGIAASVLTNINSVYSSVNICCLEQSADISNQQTCDSYHLTDPSLSAHG